MGTAKNQLSLYVFVSVLFAAGVVFGALLVGALSFEQQQELADDLGRYVLMMQDGIGPLPQESFWERFMFHGKWLLLLWLLGITVVGIPGVLALNFLKGALIGFSFGTLINEYAWKGVWFALLSIAPQNAIAVPAMIMTSAAAISFSLYVVKNRLLQQQGALMPQLISFSSTTMFMLLMFACAALFEAYVSPVIIKWGAPFVAAAAAII